MFFFSVNKSDEELDELASYSARLSNEVRRNSKENKKRMTSTSHSTPKAQRPAQPLPSEPSRPAPGTMS